MVLKPPVDHWRNHKMPRDKWKKKHDDLKHMDAAKAVLRGEVYSNTILPQETRKISNKQPNLTPKLTWKRTNKT